MRYKTYYIHVLCTVYTYNDHDRPCVSKRWRIRIMTPKLQPNVRTHTHTLHLSSVESFYVWILQPGCSGHWTLNKVQEVKVYLFVLYFYTIFSLLAGLPTQKPSALLLPFHSAHLWKSWLCAWHLNWFSGLQVCRNPRAIKVNASN